MTRDAPVTLMGRTTTTTAPTTTPTTPPPYDPATDPNSLYNLSSSVQARTAWSSTTGTGVDVALLDSGVVPVRGLDGVGKVLYGPDLTAESQNPDTRNRDAYGHGTHMAGIIAGRDAGATVTSTNKTDFLGVAPGARIVSVKVADALGHTDVSQVIAGIDWVVQHRADPGMNIRVLNLSFGTDSAQRYELDPLSYAAEVAWRKGIVVVVSAGNSGAADGRMTLPATNPFLLAVGAADTRGTSALSDDVIPSFSSRGDGVRNPDLVSPGKSVQSLRVPGSYIDSTYAASGAINSRFFRGSGTSQAAAFTSGAAALLLARYPTATPDQVKRALVSSGRTLQAADRQAQGAGLLNVGTAQMVTTTAAAGPQSYTPGTGAGSLNASRGSARLTLDGVVLDTEVDIFGRPFDAAALAAAASTETAWAGGTFNGTLWAGSAWAGSAWASTTWTGKTWAGGDWAGKTWATGTWDGKTWAGGSWTGSAWAGSAWAGSAWAGSAWAGKAWADHAWG